VLVAGEVKRRGALRQARDGVEQLEDALARYPVRDAQERRRPARSHVDRLGRCRRDIPPRRDHADALLVDARCGELVGEQVAGDDQKPGVPIGQVIQPALEPHPKSAMVDAARRLVEDADERGCRRTGRKPRACERGGDAVEQDRMRAEPAGAREDPRRGEGRERKRALGKRQEHDPRPVPWRSSRHAQVVEISAGQPARIAER